MGKFEMENLAYCSLRILCRLMQWGHLHICTFSNFHIKTPAGIRRRLIIQYRKRQLNYIT
jgi:hypothetical protein